jgi:hypothetical protein
MWRQYLRYAANVGGYHEQPTANGLENCDAKGLREAGIQKDVASAEDVSDFIVGEASEQFYSAVKIVFFNEFLKVDHASTISTNNEMNVFELCQDFRYYPNQEVDTFPVL